MSSRPPGLEAIFHFSEASAFRTSCPLAKTIMCWFVPFPSRFRSLVGAWGMRAGLIEITASTSINVATVRQIDLRVITILSFEFRTSKAA